MPHVHAAAQRFLNNSCSFVFFVDKIRLYSHPYDLPHPQLLHHRPCRPRQIHSGRPVAASNRTVPERDTTEQILDSMDLEREKGVTIKPPRTHELHCFGWQYLRIEPDRHSGHVDFGYELAGAERLRGAVLVVDAHRVSKPRPSPTCIPPGCRPYHHPVINKIDLVTARRTRWPRISAVSWVSLLRMCCESRQGWQER